MSWLGVRPGHGQVIQVTRTLGGVTTTGPEPRGRTVVSFDLRRNLINVLGEDHYPYAEYLYHELAANAFDADARRVDIVESNRVAPAPGRGASYDIEFQDDGNGMDLDGLIAYFTVGESDKVRTEYSERLKRGLIGRIGVGKVSILKVARSWVIETERHPELTETPRRLRVVVNVDDWIRERIAGFEVQELPPTGRHGTVLLLSGVTAKLREDRILRHLQRLPLDEDFMVWRNGDLVPPRRWHGIDKIDVNVVANWQEGGTTSSGPIRGEIWIRTKDSPAAYEEEPTREQDGLRREPAGIEVRVNRDVITREFFGHEGHGHAINRIWGWVDANWLPILGNRTDYQRDAPAGLAFIDAVKPVFDEAYRRVRYEFDTRAQDRKLARGSGGKKPGNQGPTLPPTPPPEGSQPGAAIGAPAGATEGPEQILATRMGEAIRKVLEDKPEFAPILDTPAERGRGRPAQDRIYPARSTGQRVPFVASPYGQSLAIHEALEHVQTRRVATGNVPRAGSRHELTDDVELLESADVTVNTKAGVRMALSPLGALEAPYRWELTNPSDLMLHINTEHPMYKATGQPGGAPHRLHCAWLVSMAFAEVSMPQATSLVSDFVESLSYELYREWGPLSK